MFFSGKWWVTLASSFGSCYISTFPYNLCLGLLFIKRLGMRCLCSDPSGYDCATGCTVHKCWVWKPEKLFASPLLGSVWLQIWEDMCLCLGFPQYPKGEKESWYKCVCVAVSCKWWISCVSECFFLWISGTLWLFIDGVNCHWSRCFNWNKWCVFPCVVYSVTLVLNIVPCSVEETVFTVVAIIKYSAIHLLLWKWKTETKQESNLSCLFFWVVQWSRLGIKLEDQK